MSDQASLDDDRRAMHASETLLDFLSYAGPAKAVVRLLLEGGQVLEGLVHLSADRSTVRVLSTNDVPPPPHYVPVAHILWAQYSHDHVTDESGHSRRW